MRIAAICGLVFTVVVFGGFRLLGGTGGETPAPVHVIRHHPFGTAATKATHKPSPSTTAAAPKAHRHNAPVAPKPVVDLAAVDAARAAGLPESLAQELGRSKVVVASLYDPYSQVDGTSFAEARAGAALAGVGFVGLNVLTQRDVGKLTQQLGLLPDPGVLVYVRPSTLAGRISGFADKETVGQAARNAAASAGS